MITKDDSHFYLRYLAKIAEEQPLNYDEIPQEFVDFFSMPGISQSINISVSKLPPIEYERIENFFNNNTFNNFDELVESICDNFDNNFDKLYASFYYVTKHVTYDQQRSLLEDRDSLSIETIFNTQKGVCSDYSVFFRILAKKVGITSEIMTISPFENASKGVGWNSWNPPTSPNYKHEANYIEIEDQFYISEPTWAVSSDSKYYNKACFLIPYYKGILERFPKETPNESLKYNFTWEKFIELNKPDLLRELCYESCPFQKVSIEENGYYEMYFSFVQPVDFIKGDIFQIIGNTKYQKEDYLLTYDCISQNLPSHHFTYSNEKRCRYKMTVSFPQCGQYMVETFLNGYSLFSVYFNVNKAMDKLMGIPGIKVKYGFRPIIPLEGLTQINSGIARIRFTTKLNRSPLLISLLSVDSNSYNETCVFDKKYCFYYTTKLPFESKEIDLNSNDYLVEDHVVIKFPKNGRWEVKIYFADDDYFEKGNSYSEGVNYFFDVTGTKSGDIKFPFLDLPNNREFAPVVNTKPKKVWIEPSSNQTVILDKKDYEFHVFSQDKLKVYFKDADSNNDKAIWADLQKETKTNKENIIDRTYMITFPKNGIYILYVLDKNDFKFFEQVYAILNSKSDIKEETPKEKKLMKKLENDLNGIYDTKDIPLYIQQNVDKMLEQTMQNKKNTEKSIERKIVDVESSDLESEEEKFLLKNKINELSKKVAELGKQKEEQENRAKLLEQEKNELNIKVSQLDLLQNTTNEDKIHELENHALSLEHEKEMQESRAKLLEQEKDELNNKVSQLEKQKEELLQNMVKEKSDAESKVQAFAKKIQELETEIQKHENHSHSLEQEKSEINDKLLELTKQKENINNRSNEQEQEKIDMSMKLHELEQQKQELEKQMNLLAEENNSMNDKINELMKQKEEEQSEEINNKLQELIKQKESINNKSNEQEQEKIEMTNKIRELEQRKLELEEQTNLLAEEKDEMNNKFNELTKQKEEQEKYSHILEQEKNELSNKVNILEKQKEELLQNMNKNNSVSDSKVQTYENMIQKLQTEIHNHEDHAHSLKRKSSKLDALVKQKEEQENQSKSLEREITTSIEIPENKKKDKSRRKNMKQKSQSNIIEQGNISLNKKNFELEKQKEELTTNGERNSRNSNMDTAKGFKSHLFVNKLKDKRESPKTKGNIKNIKAKRRIRSPREEKIKDINTEESIQSPKGKEIIQSQEEDENNKSQEEDENNKLQEEDENNKSQEEDENNKLQEEDENNQSQEEDENNKSQEEDENNKSQEEEKNIKSQEEDENIKEIKKKESIQSPKTKERTIELNNEKNYHSPKEKEKETIQSPREKVTVHSPSEIENNHFQKSKRKIESPKTKADEKTEKKTSEKRKLVRSDSPSSNHHNTNNKNKSVKERTTVIDEFDVELLSKPVTNPDYIKTLKRVTPRLTPKDAHKYFEYVLSKFSEKPQIDHKTGTVILRTLRKLLQQDPFYEAFKSSSSFFLLPFGSFSNELYPIIRDFVLNHSDIFSYEKVKLVQKDLLKSFIDDPQKGLSVTVTAAQNYDRYLNPLFEVIKNEEVISTIKNDDELFSCFLSLVVFINQNEEEYRNSNLADWFSIILNFLNDEESEENLLQIYCSLCYLRDACETKHSFKLPIEIMTTHLRFSCLQGKILALFAEVEPEELIDRNLISMLFKISEKNENLKSTLILMKLANSSENHARLIFGSGDWMLKDLPSLVDTLRLFLIVFNHENLRENISKNRNFVQFLIRTIQGINLAGSLVISIKVIRSIQLDNSLIKKMSKSGLISIFIEKAQNLDDESKVALHSLLLLIHSIAKIDFIDDFVQCANLVCDILRNDHVLLVVASFVAVELVKYKECKDIFVQNDLPEFFREKIKEKKSNQLSKNAKLFLKNLHE